MLPGLTALPPHVADFMSAVTIVQAQRPRVVRGKAILEADKVTFDPETQIARLSGNVVATYEQSKLTCTTAVLDQGTGEARFSEGVQITDPIGTLTATEVVLLFDETLKGGYAKGIVIDAYEAHFEGEELTLEKDAWRLKNAWFSTCREHYKVLLTDVVIRAGRFIQAKRSGFELVNVFKVPIPFFRVGLNPKETGIQSPVPSIDEDFELGYRWANVLTFGDRTTFSLDQRGKLESPPSTRVELSYSLLPTKEGSGILAPRNEDRERFSEGFTDNVSVRSRKQEAEQIGRDRLLIFAGGAGNVTSRARPGTPVALDRPGYVGVEVGKRIGTVFANTQVSYGEVKERLTSAAVRRMEVFTSALLPDVRLGGQLALRFRADVAAFSGGGTDYGWFRPMMSLAVSPSKEMTFTASYFSAAEWGTALFDNDRLYSKRAMHFRVDFDFPSTDVSILLKYDIDKRELYDVEFALEQVAHCIRPFVSYRKFPGAFAVGFTLRADRLLEALKKRVPVRESAPIGGNGN